MSLSGYIALFTRVAGTLSRATTQVIRADGGTALATNLCPTEGINLAYDIASEGDWAAVITEIEPRHSRLEGLVYGASAQSVER